MVPQRTEAESGWRFVPCYWRLVVHDQGGTHCVRCLSLVPGQTVEAYPGASANGLIF